MDENIVLFYRQYMQQLNDLVYPSPKLLLQPYIQKQIYQHMFNNSRALHLPPISYQRRVLKAIIEKIESAIHDPDEDEVSDPLMNHMGLLSAAKQQSGPELAQQKSIVSYYPPFAVNEYSGGPILIEESRYLLGIGSNVGLRTWDAGLRLGHYLLSEAPSTIQGKHVLELGSGTGLCSIFCAKYLNPVHVLATDGVPDVLTGINHNIVLNALESPSLISTELLNWTDLDGLEEKLKGQGQIPHYDIVIGSDITYNIDLLSPLVETFDVLQRLFPEIDIIIASVVRNVSTFNAFVKACSEKHFEVVDIRFEPPQFHQQTGFFHNLAVPILMVRIKRTDSGARRQRPEETT